MNPSVAGAMNAGERSKARVRLGELLSVNFLRSFLGQEVERLVAACEGADSFSRLVVQASELPDLLLELHGSELLRHREVRHEIVSQQSGDVLQQLLEAGNHTPARGLRDAIHQVVCRKWTPGKQWATRFCTILDLPLALAGQPDGGMGPAVEELESYVPLPALHDFQEQLRDKVSKVIQSRTEGARALLSLPTGAGKTRTCVEALVLAVREGLVSDGHILWVAQSEELCEQAFQAFREVWTHQSVNAAARGVPDPRSAGLPLIRFWGVRDLPEPLERAIIVASIQKLQHRDSPTDDVLDRVRVIVVDEAHHAIAPTYTELFSKLGFSPRGGSRAMLGLTATPYRGGEDDTRRLIRRFNSNLIIPEWENAVAELRGRGVLAYTRVEMVETRREYFLNPKEQAQYRTFSDLPEATLNRIGNDVQRNRLILERLLKMPDNLPTLFFACSVSHARAIALLLRRSGRTAAAVTADTPRALRRVWIQQFKDGEIQFLCNYGILTTGFDAPRIEAVVLGRPTSSVLLYEQMVGRGMRGPRNGGTPECLVVDLVDVFPQFGPQMSYDRYRKLWQDFSRRKLALG